MGWFGIAMFGGLAVASTFSDETRFLSIVFVGFAGLCSYCVVAIGPVVFDENQVVQSCAIGTFRIFWEEILAIERDIAGQGLLFRGRDKRLVILGPRYWDHPSRDAAWAFIEERATAQGISIQQTARAAYSWSRGVRIDSRAA